MKSENRELVGTDAERKLDVENERQPKQLFKPPVIEECDAEVVGYMAEATSDIINQFC